MPGLSDQTSQKKGAGAVLGQLSFVPGEDTPSWKSSSGLELIQKVSPGHPQLQSRLQSMHRGLPASTAEAGKREGGWEQHLLHTVSKATSIC